MFGSRFHHSVGTHVDTQGFVGVIAASNAASRVDLPLPSKPQIATSAPGWPCSSKWIFILLASADFEIEECVCAGNRQAVGCHDSRTNGPATCRADVPSDVRLGHPLLWAAQAIEV